MSGRGRPRDSGTCPGCGTQGNYAKFEAGLCPACRDGLPPSPRDVFSREAVERDLAISRLSHESNPHLATLADRLGTARDMLNAVGIIGNAQLKLVRLAAAKANAARHDRFKHGTALAEPWAGYSQWPF